MYWFYFLTLQRQNGKNLKQIFPGKEYRGLSPNFHIHVSVSELYIPTMGLPFLLEEICGPILGIYKSLTDTNVELGAEAAQFPEKGIFQRNCRCSVWSKHGLTLGKERFFFVLISLFQLKNKNEIMKTMTESRVSVPYIVAYEHQEIAAFQATEG